MERHDSMEVVDSIKESDSSQGLDNVQGHGSIQGSANAIVCQICEPPLDMQLDAQEGSGVDMDANHNGKQKERHENFLNLSIRLHREIHSLQTNAWSTAEQWRLALERLKAWFPNLAQLVPEGDSLCDCDVQGEYLKLLDMAFDIEMIFPSYECGGKHSQASEEFKLTLSRQFGHYYGNSMWLKDLRHRFDHYSALSLDHSNASGSEGDDGYCSGRDYDGDGDGGAHSDDGPNRGVFSRERADSDATVRGWPAPLPPSLPLRHGTVLSSLWNACCPARGHSFAAALSGFNNRIFFLFSRCFQFSLSSIFNISSC